ncbi:hypothetical protein [Bifidobacterium psychraerophilum]|uniref:hypothetical protein n=1 Tax=Bifidobacterium psychraerophilum TaxID=218140 RepID=UPI0023EFC086|nr:hypothetical protein [Bifidobacterium psychraerophilum]MCI1659931.1 hypothetical protein [Bifidobacterium psychraerophilum]MCI1805179.1 hypothetical protein [Bifidobacterium psychraerophilum]MCI2176758.1 hypothetical protein [Bifidobacterium psychraerophilum]MCI2181431.1 hypothetical protein [Bifidobacterium psychraerophilum]
MSKREETTMSNNTDFISRDFTRYGDAYQMRIGKPEEIELDCWRAEVRLMHGDDTVWCRVAFGVDGVQAVFFGFELTRVLLESEGGYLFLGQSDLQFVRDPPMEE